MGDARTAGLLVLALSAGLPATSAGVRGADAGQPVYPAAEWEKRTPEQVGLSAEKLKALGDLTGGRGCVVRQGYLVYSWGDPAKSGDIASAVKPVVSTLLLLAVQQGKLKDVDAKVADFEPRLRDLNRGKDAGITWRHLASQTSGYGLAEAPGVAYAYNDFALALYYDTLTRQVYRRDGTRVLKEQLGDVLGFQDRYTFEAFGPDDRPGRLAISARDLARFGLLYLRGGRWKDRQVLTPESVRTLLSSPVPAGLPRTRGGGADMLPKQRSLGGGKDQTPAGPGYYSFNWWLNRTDGDGRRFYADAPPDTFVAMGHGGERALWVVPSLDLVVAWNGARIDDHDASPGNPRTKCNQAARLMRDAVLRQTHVTVRKDQWLVNDVVTYRGAKAEGRLMNVRMVNVVFEDTKRHEFDPGANTERFVERVPAYVRHGVRAFTINLQGGMPGYEGAVNSAFDAEGNLRGAYLRRVRRVIEACDREGAVVILGCFYQRQDQLLRDEAAVRAGVVNVAQWVKGCGFTNVVLEIANEFGHGGFDHRLLKTAAGQVELIGLAKKAHPALLVSTSGLGDGTIPGEVARAADFVLVHFNGTKIEDMPARIKALQEFGKPVVCNEDAKVGEAGAKAAEVCVANGASWGLMAEKVNQHYPFAFRGAADDEAVYSALKALTTKSSNKDEATELGKLAAGMKPGTWAELKTEGYTAELLKVQNHHILEYTAAAAWDPTSRQVLFVGQGHYSALKFISYDAAANAWKLRETPPWWKGDAQSGKGPIGHAYYNNAIDPVRGVFYLHQSATRLVHRYDVAKETWTTLPEITGAATGHGTAIAYFPERRGLVRVLGGAVHFFSEEKNEWTRLRDKLAMGPYHNVAHYSAAHEVVLFGGGNNSKDLYGLDGEGNITRLKPAPVEVGINTAVVTSDPVSGDILVLHKDDKFYSLDPATDAWKELGTEGMPFRMKGSSFDVVATPVSDHGVTLFFTAERRGLKVFLYKHTAPRK